eukprot:1159443-Pelagomonas_calceolata.AAC.4
MAQDFCPFGSAAGDMILNLTGVTLLKRDPRTAQQPAHVPGRFLVAKDPTRQACRMQACTNLSDHSTLSTQHDTPFRADSSAGTPPSASSAAPPAGPMPGSADAKPLASTCTT